MQVVLTNLGICSTRFYHVLDVFFFGGGSVQILQESEVFLDQDWPVMAYVKSCLLNFSCAVKVINCQL